MCTVIFLTSFAQISSYNIGNLFLSIRMFLSGFLLLLQSLLIVALDERTNGDVCQEGLYGELVPVLKPHGVAQAYCAQAYPVTCRVQKMVMVRKVPLSTTSKSSATPSVSSTIPKTSTNSSKTTTKVANPKESAWSKLLQQGRAVVSTLCSCIQDPKVSDKTMAGFY